MARAYCGRGSPLERRVRWSSCVLTEFWPNSDWSVSCALFTHTRDRVRLYSSVEISYLREDIDENEWGWGLMASLVYYDHIPLKLLQYAVRFWWLTSDVRRIELRHLRLRGRWTPITTVEIYCALLWWWFLISAYVFRRVSEAISAGSSSRWWHTHIRRPCYEDRVKQPFGSVRANGWMRHWVWHWMTYSRYVHSAVETVFASHPSNWPQSCALRYRIDDHNLPTNLIFRGLLFVSSDCA